MFIVESVILIGRKAFKECTNLSQVGFIKPSFISSFGDHAFEYCSSLSQIIISSSVAYFGSYAFGGCFSLEKSKVPIFLVMIFSN